MIVVLLMIVVGLIVLGKFLKIIKGLIMILYLMYVYLIMSFKEWNWEWYLNKELRIESIWWLAGFVFIRITLRLVVWLRKNKIN
jgi:hypothetical protein